MLPYPLKITSAVLLPGVSVIIMMTNTNRSLIKEFVLAGSNDGYTWTNLYEGTSALTSTYSAINVSMENKNYYLRLVIKVQSQALLLLMLCY
jgi:hypothetical protein